MVDGAPQPAKHPLGEMHMIGNRARERVLALDVRSGKCAFAVFEGPHRLLDFGSRSFARKYGPLKTTARKRFINLLNLYSPNLIVFRSASTGSNKTKARVNLIASTLRQIARGQSVRLRFISRKKVKAFFRAQALETKHAIASQLADRYFDLSWRLPPKRKVWQAEYPQMAVFDAAATAIVYFQCPIVQTS